MITFRVDVDYPYSNRLKSFLSTLLRVKLGNGYLENSKIIAQMMNESDNEVKCFWFFTVNTFPDREMLTLLNNPRHEICLHVVSDVYEEWINLEYHLMRLHGEKTFEYMVFNPKVKFYNRHGIDNFLTRIIWHKLNSDLIEPNSLSCFSNDNTVGLDMLCSCVGQKKAYQIAKGFQIIYFHPDWLFQTGKLNRRGRFFEVLEKLLLTDNRLLEEVIV